MTIREIVNEYKDKGTVMFIGDGINDAPALTVADTGIALGNGTDIAMDSADVILNNNNLKYGTYYHKTMNVLVDNIIKALNFYK